MRQSQSFYLIVLGLILIIGCRVDPPIVNISESHYPKEIAKIILSKCAVPGCHNNISKDAAGGLSLETWDKMFEGSRTGAITIPFNHRQSPLFLFVNTFDDLGLSMKPTMPVNNTPLTREEVVLIRDWVENGAPGADGLVKFSEDPKLKKVYVVNQGCDLVSVIDQKTNLIMRYVEVGNKPLIEAPHMIKVSPDGKYWYVIFTAGDVIQRYRTSDDSFAGEVFIDAGNWNTFSISSDSKQAYIINWAFAGSVAVVDLENMLLLRYYQGPTEFKTPHGSTLSKDNKTLYITAQDGNFIIKVDIQNINFPEVTHISLDNNPINSMSSLDPHEIEISPDGTKYYVICQKTNEIRVMDVATDELLTVIPTGVFPQELMFSKTSDYAFISCTEDTQTFPGERGSVTVINYKSNTFVKHIYTGHQPHGIAVDDKSKQVYVAHRNQNTSGPAPHHSTYCGGRNGYMTIIDMNRLELLSSKRYELSVDPYFIDIRD
ncbi:MAG: hypothetical protein H0V01_14100 [Bacteroidetes bacterium]|nr:hypothetical protein [Bacteroidota bacterium]HET6245126.1 hypothetical protein [Bacteroidia bacterium]